MKYTQKCIDNFHKNYIKQDDGCWVWQLAKFGPGGNGKGRPYGAYGVRTVDGSKYMMLTHRLMWELVNGEVPKGKQIAHTCEHPACVNPEHLIASTRSEIVSRAAAKSSRPNLGRPDCGDQTACEHCGMYGGKLVMGRWHGQNCRHKLTK